MGLIMTGSSPPPCEGETDAECPSSLSSSTLPPGAAGGVRGEGRGGEGKGGEGRGGKGGKCTINLSL